MSEELYKQIHKNGEYYNPANNHYNNDNGVECDRCKKTELDTCIGWQENDLCMKCISAIDKIKKGGFRKKSLKKSSTGSVGSSSRGVLRKMRQKMFRKTSRVKTRMMQKQFVKK